MSYREFVDTTTGSSAEIVKRKAVDGAEHMVDGVEFKRPKNDVVLVHCQPELALLPAPVIQTIASYLDGSDVNCLRCSCKNARNAIDRDLKKSYGRRLVSFDMVNFLGKWTIVLKRREKGVILFSVQDNVCTDVVPRLSPSDPLKVLWNREMAHWFIGRTLPECIEIWTERSGGIQAVKVEDDLSSNDLSVFEPLFAKSRELILHCKLDEIDEELQYTYFFSPRRKLKICKMYLENNVPLMQDRFWQEAGWGCLEVIQNNFNRVELTDSQLANLVSRMDLENVYIRPITGPSLQGIRNAIQILLNSTMICCLREIKVPNYQQRTFDDVIRQRLGAEDIHAINSTNPDQQLDIEEDSRCYRYTSKTSTVILLNDFAQISIFTGKPGGVFTKNECFKGYERKFMNA